MNVENLVNKILTERAGSGQTIDPEFKDFLKKFFTEDSDEFKQIMYVVSHPKFKFWMTEYDYDNSSMKIVWRPITYSIHGLFEFDIKYFADIRYNWWDVYKTLEKKHNKPFCNWPLIDKIFYITSKDENEYFKETRNVFNVIRGSSYGGCRDKLCMMNFRKLFVACLDIAINDFKLGEDYFKIEV